MHDGTIEVDRGPMLARSQRRDKDREAERVDVRFARVDQASQIDDDAMLEDRGGSGEWVEGSDVEARQNERCGDWEET